MLLTPGPLTLKGCLRLGGLDLKVHVGEGLGLWSRFLYNLNPDMLSQGWVTWAFSIAGVFLLGPHRGNLSISGI